MIDLNKFDNTIKLYLDKLKAEDGDDYKDLLNVQIDKALTENIDALKKIDYESNDDTIAINFILAGILLLHSPPSIALNIINNRIEGYLPDVTYKSEDDD